MLDTVQDFTRQGHAVFEDALSPDTLTMLRDICDALLAAPPEDGGAGKHNIGQGAARRFLAHRHEDFPALEAFLLSPVMARITSACLGTPGYLFNEQFVVKGAHRGGSFAWHQDGAYVPFAHRPYLSVWMALDDATEENGCVYLLSRDLDARPGIDRHEKVGESDELNGYSGPDTGLPMTCKAGTIVAFSSLTLHRSGANSTPRQRRAFLAQYSAEPLLDPATGAPRRFAKPLPAA